MVPELDIKACAAVLATFQRKSLSQLVRDTIAFMKNLKFYLLPNTIFCERFQYPESLFSLLMKEQLEEKHEVGKESPDMSWVVRSLFQLDVSRMFVYYFTRRHPDEIEIVRTSPREYRQRKYSWGLAVLISNVDENGIWALSDGGVKHFLVPASIMHDVSSYVVDRAEGKISVYTGITLSGECIKLLIITKGDVTDKDLLIQGFVQGKYAVVYSSGTGNLNSDLFIRWLKECYFLDFEAKRIAIKQRNALAILLTDS
ncbi:MAG: hypothetical protein EZS28_013865 [Streblomastix strix]|uniref:DDE-1 domain-containing protein n=1 Tax=Streblomastix strix TaxID=222440 RepID=A0A5J4W6Z0_9EUKA|nr:MAG: hypothetical protein EZS28_013865 [Streblomastix strix]